MISRLFPGGQGAPLFVPLLALVLVSLAAAELINTVIVLVLPRPAPAVHRLSDLEQVLGGASLAGRDAEFLTVDLRRTPPVMPGGGEFRARIEQRIARDLGVTPDMVAFTPFSPRSGPMTSLAPPGLARRASAQPFRRAQRMAELVQPGLSAQQSVLLDPFQLALRQPDGQWRAIESKDRGLLDPWRQRIFVWFMASALAMTPLAYLFARRLADPIRAFAAAAERLGRDPDAPPLQIKGPAEVGMAARAFNEMQDRLRRYVHDRTSMIGAIAHDLRTPLTRLRFQAESAPEELRARMAADIAEMDAMLTATLTFVRDAAQGGEHARLELPSHLERVVDEYAELGHDVRLDHADPAVVLGDSLALKRLFANLIDNAVKFGGSARLRLLCTPHTATVDVEDHGPGLPDAELERAFEPFRRGEPSRNRDTGGMGLGLAVARSIARAHGGDVTLANLPGGGLRARVLLPV